MSYLKNTLEILIVTICTFCATMLVAGANDYDAAYYAAIANKNPLVILISEPWCPPCQQLKKTLAELDKSFELAIISTSDPLAAKLMRGNSIPQMFIYTQEPDGWYVKHFTGNLSKDKLEKALER